MRPAALRWSSKEDGPALLLQRTQAIRATIRDLALRELRSMSIRYPTL